MRIVIAAWHLTNFNVGIGRYTRNLIESIGRVDKENQYEILVPNGSPSIKPWPNIRYHHFGFSALKQRYWEQFAHLLVGKYDLLHFPYDSCIAVKRGKFVATIHDVIPMLFPKGNNHRPMKGWVKRMMIPKPFEKLDHVLTVSECSKRDIMKQLGVPEERISVIYQGVESDRFFPTQVSQLERNGNPPYILCVAGNGHTKNVVTLLDAYSRLPKDIREECQLVLVGDVQKQKNLPPVIQQLGLEKHVVFTGIISDERLARLYQDASAFVFPTLYEGFGLPVLEAMACGCPVIASNTSSLPEVVGNAGVLIDPLDVSSMSAAIQRVLCDRDLAERLRKEGIERAKQFCWDRTARETIDLYRKVINSHPN